MERIMSILVGDGEDSSIIVVVPGEDAPLVATSQHPNFKAICRAAAEQDYGVVELFDIAETLAQNFQRLSERVSSANGRLYLDGEELSGLVTEHILRAMESGLTDWQPLVSFIENVAQNPNPRSVEQLYDWIKAEGLTIDTDGMIVAYKGVEPTGFGNFKSVHGGKAIVNGHVQTGRIIQNIGDVVEMPRSDVEFNPGVGCSRGLHVGTHSYASGWGSHLLEVRVNPRDVVSVPTDCSAQKMRTCRYTIADSFAGERPYDTPVLGGVFDDSDPFEYDEWGDGEDDYAWLNG
jgi:hypothetical protein